MKIDYHKYNIKLLEDAMSLVSDIRKLGYEAYAVGGCVRDLVRYVLQQSDTLDIHDVDIATNMPIDSLKKQYTTRSNNGEKHGTILVLHCGEAFEVTQFRNDGEYSDGRHPDSVTFAKTFREDASRRDFTINAMGLDDNGDVVDYFDGVADIVNRKVRTVGDPDQRFGEDSLRMIRALRFANVFGYSLDKDTADSIKRNADKLDGLTLERVRKEFMSVVSRGNFYTFVNMVMDLDIMHHIKALSQCNKTSLLSALPRMYARTFLKEHAPTVLLNERNLVPVLAFLSHSPYQTLESLVPTREEKDLFQWYVQNKHVVDSGNWETSWTDAVKFVSGDFVTLIAATGYTVERCSDFIVRLQTALFLKDNHADPADIRKKVASMGVAPGKEYGETVRRLTEEDYARRAKQVPPTIAITIGNTIVHYAMDWTEPNKC